MLYLGAKEFPPDTNQAMDYSNVYGPPSVLSRMRLTEDQFEKKCKLVSEHIFLMYSNVNNIY